jgi:hypothetical protein
MIDQPLLSAEIGRLLAVLYAKRFAALDRLTLTTLLAKNPYLYRAMGESDPLQLLKQMLMARVSSSDETIFGNDFFEPLAMFAARYATGGERRTVTVGAGAGQDIAIETASEYLAISVKSGINIFNSQSEKGQSAEFNQLQARMKKLGKMFRPIVGYGYGRKAAPKKPQAQERLAGQAFWSLLTGEDDFHVRIEACMGPFAAEHSQQFAQALVKKHCLLVREFSTHFIGDTGEILWAKLVDFNSGTKRPARLRAAPTQPHPNPKDPS